MHVWSASHRMCCGARQLHCLAHRFLAWVGHVVFHAPVRDHASNLSTPTPSFRLDTTISTWTCLAQLSMHKAEQGGRAHLKNILLPCIAGMALVCYFLRVRVCPLLVLPCLGVPEYANMCVRCVGGILSVLSLRGVTEALHCAAVAAQRPVMANRHSQHLHLSGSGGRWTLTAAKELP